MVCPHCQTENSEQARYCIACGQPLPRRCLVCGALNPPEARFCNQCGSPLQPSVAAVAPPAAVPAATPPERAPRYTAPPAEEVAEQRRVVTVLFADLTSSTTLAENMDPEDARAMLAAFFDTMAREIQRHGGTVEKYIGDAVMAVFGLPVAHEDDPVRAVRAAFDMGEALRRFNADRRLDDPTVPELQVRIGINTGEVAAAGQAQSNSDFLVTGDAVNVAARLQQMAAPGTILVGPRTYRGTAGAVVYRALPSVALRGKTRPMKVWEAAALVGAGDVPAPRPRGVEGLRAPLVGRDVEMELLRTLYARVKEEARPHLVTILGVPGIGKTRLAREFLDGPTGITAVARVRRPRGHATATSRAVNRRGGPDRVLSTAVATLERRQVPGEPPLLLEGRCPPYGEGITYWPLAEMLRTRFNVSPLQAPESARASLLAGLRALLAEAGRADDPETLAAYLGYTIGIESAERRQALLPRDRQQFQEGLLRAWRVFFEAVAGRRGLILFIEDIHWADDALLDLLEYVAARASGVPLLLLCTARPNLLERRPDWGGGKRNYATIALEALTPMETRALVRALLPGGNLPETLRRGILEKAEGNPFYTEEIIRMFVDRGILVKERGDGWSVAPEWADAEEVRDPSIPDTVQGVLAARLDLLDAEERDVLQHASVIGRFFWPSALLALAGHLDRARLNRLLDALCEKDLVLLSEQYLGSVAPAEEPVYTFQHALTREVVYNSIARTRRAHEHQRVAEWLETLASGREDEFAELLAQHYRQYYVQANLAHARNPARRADVLAKVERYLMLAGDRAAARHAANKAEDYYTDAITFVEDEGRQEDLALRVRLYARRGDARWAALRADDAWSDYRAALDIWRGYQPPADALDAPKPERPRAARSAGPPSDWTALGLWLYRQLVQLPTRFTGYFRQTPTHEELRTYLDAGLKLAESVGWRDSYDYAALLTAKAFFWLSWPEQRGEGELLDALRSAREAVRIAEVAGDPRGISAALDALGNILGVTNDLRGYLESQTRRLDYAPRIEDTGELVDIHAEISQASQVVGSYANAVSHGQTALTLATATEADPLRLQALRALTVAHFEWDRWDDALRIGADLLALMTPADLRFSHRQQLAIFDMAIIHARRREFDTAEQLLRKVTETQPQSASQYVEQARARLALARGAFKEARHTLLSALECRDGRIALPALYADLAEFGAIQGDGELYRRFAPLAQELGWRSGARKPLAQTIRARAIVSLGEGKWDDALADAQSALARYQELGTPWEEARTRYVLAGLYRRRAAEHDANLARDELELALTAFTGLRAQSDMARVRAALAGGEIRLP